jgi:type IV secretory pathway VirB10-like protein
MDFLKMVIAGLLLFAFARAEQPAQPPQQQQKQPVQQAVQPQTVQQNQPAQPQPPQQQQKQPAAPAPQAQSSAQSLKAPSPQQIQPSAPAPQQQPAQGKSTAAPSTSKKDFPPRSYRVRDNTGNLIIETEDSSLVAKMSNVKVEVVDQPLKLFTLQNDTMIDNLKFILEKKLGSDAQTKAVFYYTIEWIVPGGGHLTLNKGHKKKPTIIADWKSQRWLRENVPGLLDDAR